MSQLKEKLLSSIIAFEEQNNVDSYVHGIRTKSIKKFEKEGFDYFVKKFIIYKGSISINGVSLTISSVNKDFFSVSLIPETLKRTNLVNLKSNDLVNVEIDIFAKYIENFLKN